MINRDDLALAWLRKAESDLTTIGAAIDAGALDTACFHGQQAVESGIGHAGKQVVDRIVALPQVLKRQVDAVASGILAQVAEDVGKLHSNA